ncbi:MAG TPA: hypothetical protein VKW06_18375 [Candidatus Angelobacter sp.]|nr:hypothetical protein [Candidatus Angelobacter sp.]
MTPDLLARMLQQFLAESPGAAVIEDGRVVFDLDAARYSVSAERGRCLLHLWSEERNLVREIVDAEVKRGALTLSVRGFAKARAHKMEICRDRDRRSQASRTSSRSRYARLLERVLHREMPDWSLSKTGLSTTMDLERSFSPVYARGLLRKGRSTLAVLGVGSQETQAAVDASLTFGLLWLEACREREAGRALVEGLRIYIPPKSSSALQIRMAHLNRNAAKLELFELEERDESVNAIDSSDYGNISTRLVRCPDTRQAHERFRQAIARVQAAAPQAEMVVLSGSEISFRVHGLEFARARLAAAPGVFKVEEEIVFGVAGFEVRLTAETEPAFAEFARTVVEARATGGDRRDPLWRMYPERWLESLVFKDVSAIDSRLDPAHVYSQVPAFSASDRAMIDVLACTHDHRLAVLELKADEDIHLPLQGLDYWARVVWHQQRGEFAGFGYFPGITLSSQPPLLLLVAPSLRVHPSVDIVLRYFASHIEWGFVGVDERWRDGLKVIYRKKPARKARA